ncbi:MAG: T9SS type A sorting domain-containing protein [Bacteroidota bacterium]
MKKIYLLSLALIATFASYASGNVRISPKGKNAVSETRLTRQSQPGNSATQVAGNIVCTSTYQAGTSQSLNFTLTFTNTDYEYGDSLALTFPAGMTPTGTANQPDFAPITDAGTGQTPEAYNGVNGQTITWGDNDNAYGGIEALGNAGGVSSYNFTVDVNIGAGVSGNQTVDFYLSGDGFGPSPGDLVGTITIYPAGSSIVDASCTIAAVLGLTSCNNDSLPIGVAVKNLGNVTLQNVPVSFSIDGGTPVTEIIPDSIVPGDSIIYQFNALGDFSATNFYSVAVYTSVVGDLFLNNDTFVADFANTVSVDLSSTPYANDFEVGGDYVGVTAQAVSGSGGNWGVATTAVQSGVRCLGLIVNTGAADAWLYLPCMDVTAGDNYRITYWKRTTTGYNGSLGISYGIDQDIAEMINTVRPLTANNANSTWELDSVDFVPTTTETIYIGFHGQGTATGSGTSIRFDNINIFPATPATAVGSTNVADLISVYPNPAKSQLNVKFAGNKGSIEMFDLLGNNVIESRTAVLGNNTIDVSSLSNGTYFVKVTVDGNAVTRKVTVNN